jgi:hypothetical protein
MIEERLTSGMLRRRLRGVTRRLAASQEVHHA